MDRRPQLDVARRAAVSRVKLFPLALPLLMMALSAPHATQATPQSPLSLIKRVYAAKRWKEVVRLTPPERQDAPGIDYYRGMALAKLNRWDEAQTAFLRGWRKAPQDKRFPTELAGVAFTRKNCGAAKTYLRRALKIDPHDAYALNFLATIYDLDGNLPAALKYWNRLQQPRIRDIRVTPQPSVNPVLLNRAFAFSPDATLEASQWLTTQARIDSFGIFLRPRLDLTPLPDGRFDAKFIAKERNGWGDSTPQGAASLLRGVPYDTIYPTFFNLGHSATNLTSLVRWDPQKQRIYAALDGPIGESAQWRYRVHLDGRRENWNLSSTFFGSATPVRDMRMEKLEGGADIESIASGRLRWDTGFDLSGRSFRRVEWSDPSAAAFFTDGFALESHSSVHYLVLEVPERRLNVESGAGARLGKVFTRSANSFLQSEAGLRARWHPRARGDDYEMTAQLRAGKTWGTPPFDNLFILGLERDNNLWLRAHIGTADGKKGSAPLGRDYVLFNWDDFKTLFQNGLLSLRLGPFLDSGKITDPSRDFGSRRWLLDAGLELKAQVMGAATVELFFGKDL
ncbi:MAG: tetratricopeptide repeat protein, partial [Terriglobia bacterium]